MTHEQQNNAANMEKVREAMAQAQLGQTVDQVNLGARATWTTTLDYTSPVGIQYRGELVFKRPSAKDLMTIGGLKAQYFRDAGIEDLTLVDTTVRLLAHVLAHVKVVVVKSPEWFFNVDAIEDMDIIYEVYERFKAWEDSFRKPIPEPSAGNSEPSEDAKALDS